MHRADQVRPLDQAFCRPERILEVGAAPFEFRRQGAVQNHQRTPRKETVYWVTHDCSRQSRFTIILPLSFARGLVRDSIMLTAQTIKNQHSDIFTFLHGVLEIEAIHCHVPEEAFIGSLVYVMDASQLPEVR